MGYVPTGGSGGASIGGTVTGATAGSVFFAGAAGVMAQDNAGFFYDDANNQLKLTASAATQTPLQINLASAQSANALEVKNSGGTVIFAVAGATPAVGAPQIHFGTATTGIWEEGGTAINFVYSGVRRVTWDLANNAVRLDSAGQLTWSNTSANPAATNDVGLARTGVNILKITNASTGAGALHMQEMTAPSAPATNNVYIYAQDNGAGKTQLMALFGSGVAQQLAIEP